MPSQKPPTDRPRATESIPGAQPPRSTVYANDRVLSSGTQQSAPFSEFSSDYADKARKNLEEFVGKNLISLIGIIVLVLGVGIGAKYAIDNNWISPLTRIIIGYVFGFALVGLAIKLKPKYHNFSAVLISGGMSIMYFVTYFAYSAYELLSQMSSFGLMVMFTILTVAAALVYSRQVIAHIGLVGAYAVPFLLSNDSGNYPALFGYMTVINTGILAISLKKAWKPIFYTASGFTWLIFGGWFFTKYAAGEHFELALIFLGAFFVIFYVSRLLQEKFLGSDDDRTENMITAFLTTLVFYGFCYALVYSQMTTQRLVTFLIYLAVAAVFILATALRNNWVAMFSAAAGVTWLTFGTWFYNHYSPSEHFYLTLTFLGVFFAIFYGAKILEARLRDDGDDLTENRIGAILNGAVFYGFCFAIVNVSLAPAGYWMFFSYLAGASIIILATSFRFYERMFMYLVIPATWLIFGAWFATRYDAAVHFDLAATFAALFFAIFYFSILYHRLIENNFTLVEHTSLILSNASIFYGFGYTMLDRSETLNGYLGLYTVAHAALHLIVAFVVKALRRDAIDVVQVLTILVLTFASIAIPVQFDGNVVTMVWATEGAMLFWFGRTRGVKLFEYFSLPIIALATGSMAIDWITSFSDRANGLALTPVANSDFITAIVFVTSFAFIYITNRDRKHEPALTEEYRSVFHYLVAGAGVLALYNMFRVEIDNFYFVRWRGLFPEALSAVGPRGDLEKFNQISQLDYTLLFLSVMCVVNLRKMRSLSLAGISVGLSLITIAVFVTGGLFLLNDLRVIYVSGAFDPAYFSSWLYVAVRPISYVVAIGLVYCLYEYSRDSLFLERFERRSLIYAFDGLLYPFFFLLTSAELLNLMGQFGIPDGAKLGLSILWGLYAIMMVVIGIARDKKHLRVAAMVLLFATLAKLFFYDIAELETIQKTILFVTLGIILLVVSFLYNKYKAVIFKTDASLGD